VPDEVAAMRAHPKGGSTQAPTTLGKRGNGETWLNLRGERVCGPAHYGWQTVAAMAESGVGRRLAVPIGGSASRGRWRRERDTQAWCRVGAGEEGREGLRNGWPHWTTGSGPRPADAGGDAVA
jgi:hypothetical protein